MMKRGITKMKYLNFDSEYDKNPIQKMTLNHALIWDEASEIVSELSKISSGIIVFETYPGIDLKVLKEHILDKLHPNHIINIEAYTKSAKAIDKMIKPNLTDDRVFGYYSHHVIDDFYDQKKLHILREDLNQKNGLIIVYGFGASQIKADYLIFVSLTRWEIQLRYRRGLTNFKKHNEQEDILRKYKRGYFVEWRVADRMKDDVIKQMNYFIDYSTLNHPVMIDHQTYHQSLDQLVKKPFRMVPYFDPGIWGGQWMKEVCLLDPNESNYAWSFDGVPEENSIKLDIKGKIIELPAQDVVQFRPVELMGQEVYDQFGPNFPIRFDLLDTMDGGNLSLQVHPLKHYIQETFGMAYTQDESYYILDSGKDGSVYLGFKENIDQKQFKKDLIAAQAGKKIFDDKLYINRYPAKKHDHFLIPAGTIHCSGKNTMVLEISACMYIFTFKLWDWDRKGLDGRPRPVHLEHGFKNLQFDRNTTFVNEQLINTVKPINDKEEYTGLHELEFLETRRFTFSDFADIDTYDRVNVANLVEGKKAVIQSIDGRFEDYEVHYAETFVIPSTIHKFRITCLDRKQCIIIKAHVR